MKIGEWNGWDLEKILQPNKKMISVIFLQAKQSGFGCFIDSDVDDVIDHFSYHEAFSNAGLVYYT